MKTKHILQLPFAVVGLVILFWALIIMACESRKTKDPIKIGLPATLSGTASSFGRHVRNGAVLAVEQANGAGGVDGRPVELIIKDDKGDPEEALRVDRELIAEGVVAILGHYLSTLAVKTVPLMNEKNVLMVNATGSTDELSGIDDNFIRLMVPVDKQALSMACVSRDRLGLGKMAVVYDISNRKYTEPFYGHFKKEFEKQGREISATIVFDSRETYSTPDIARGIMLSGAEGLLIITNAFHGALICQHLRKNGSPIKMLASGWCFPDPDFIRIGGAAVEGVVSVSVFDKESSSERFVSFKREYENRFGEEFGMGAQLGCEAARVLIRALSKTDDPKKMKEAILKQKVFQGLDGRIVFDQYGDPDRELYVSEIRKGKIQTMGRTNPFKALR